MDKTQNSDTLISSDENGSAAIYSLWFGLDYGSILTAYALYHTLSACKKKPYLIQKLPQLWGDHYAEKDNIAGKFIYKNCDVLEVFSSEADKEKLSKIDTHIIGSDVVWDCKIVGQQAEKYFYLSNVERDTDIRIAYGTSVGSNYNIEVDKRYDYSILLHKFKGISVKSFDESIILSDMFYIQPNIVIDSIFLIDREKYIGCAEQSAAAKVEKEKRFIFTYIKNGDKRKKSLVLRGNKILLEKYCSPLRNFIDINRYPESKAALGLEPAFHILVEDWLHYIINSNFVITDDYYGMCFAILFEKNFVVIANREMRDLSRYTTLLEQLDLTERFIYIDDDFKTKDYLFRKPVRYDIVSKKLSGLKEDSYKWLKSMLISNDDGVSKQGEN